MILSNKNRYNTNITSTNIALKRKFGGKEYQDELGLDWYDITARNYDPALGRWMNVDPHSENYYNLSTYNFVANNPIYFVDPDGKDIVIGLDEGVNAFYKDGKLYTDSTYETEFTNSKYVRKNGTLRSGFLKDVVKALDTLREENISLDDGETNFIESLQEGSYLTGGHTTYISEGERSSHQKVSTQNGGTISKIKLNRGESYLPVPTEYGFISSNISNSVAHELGHSYSFKNGTYDESIIGYDANRNPIVADEYVGSYVENRYRKASGQGLRTHYEVIYNQYDQPNGMNVQLLKTQNIGGNTIRRAIKSNKNGSISFFNFNF